MVGVIVRQPAEGLGELPADREGVIAAGSTTCGEQRRRPIARMREEGHPVGIGTVAGLHSLRKDRLSSPCHKRIKKWKH